MWIGTRCNWNGIELRQSLFDRVKELTLDALTMAVSLFDVLSDVYISYTLWRHSQFSYFCISVAILAITHLSYCILFVRMRLFKLNHAFLYVLLLIPVSPFLSFVLYSSAKPVNEIDERDPTKRWIEYNLRKHIGFICESLLESFASFVLQVYVLLMSSQLRFEFEFELSISILLSLLSISMSLYLFCHAHSIYFPLFLFNYLCVMCDFVKLFTLIVMVSRSRSMFVYIWCIKLLFITATSALYLSIQFVWSKIDGDLNSNWYQITRNFGAVHAGGRRRSISRSQSKSKSKSKSNIINTAASAHSNTNPHLSTYHISDPDAQNNKSQRRHRTKLWHFMSESASCACVSWSPLLSEIAFVLLFGGAVALLWPFMILCLEIASFSLIAFVIDRFNTSRFLSIHWNLWQYIFAFLLRRNRTHSHLNNVNCSNYTHQSYASRSQTQTLTTTMHTLSPTDIDSANCNCTDHDEMSYGDAFNHYNDVELSQVSQSQVSQHTSVNYLDATELEVRLNTLANSGTASKNIKHRIKKQANIKHKTCTKSAQHIEYKDIPWSEERDVIIRLSTINYILAQHRESKKLFKYLDAAFQDSFFAHVELRELRYYSSQGMTPYDAVFRYHHRNIIEKWYALSKHKNANQTHKTLLFYAHYLYKKGELLLKWLHIFIVLPLYFVSQLLFIASPYVLFLDAFAHAPVLAAYTAFVIALLLVFPSVYKFTKITSYIHHNCILYFSSYHSSFNDIERKIMADINHLYHNLVATQIRKDCLIDKFGDDICELIQSYLPRFHVIQMNESENEEETTMHLHHLHDHDDSIYNNHNNLQICVTPAKSQCNNQNNQNQSNNNISDHSGYDNDTDHSIHSN